METATQIQPEESISPNDIMSIEDFVERYPHIWPSMNRARWACRNRDTNGLSEFKAVGKRQGRMFVIVPRLIDWIANGK